MKRTTLFLLMLSAFAGTASAQYDAVLGGKPGTYLAEITVDAAGQLTIRQLRTFLLGSGGNGPIDPDPGSLSPTAATIRAATIAAATKSSNATKYRTDIAGAYRAVSEALTSELIEPEPVDVFARVEAALLDRATQGEVDVWFDLRQTVRDTITATEPRGAAELATQYDQASIGVAIPVAELAEEGIFRRGQRDRINRALDWTKIMEFLKIIITLLKTFGVL